jgi:hypothetical protein
LPQPSNLTIIGVALVLFSAILLGVGIHHVVATGTCSSTGYSADYGPVPTCPAGTGWWFAFLFGGIFGCLIGAAMARSVGLVFAGIFGAIGFGALSNLLDSSASTGTKVFAAAFGGCFALVGVIAGIVVIRSALSSTGGSAKRKTRGARGKEAGLAVAGGNSAFGTPATDVDPIMSAYNASQDATSPTLSSTAPARSNAPPATGPTQISPLNLVPGLQAAAAARASHDPIDELTRLGELHKQGVLSDEEFATAKAKLLKQM